MRDLDELAKNDFDPLIGNLFQLDLGDEQTLLLELVSTESLVSEMMEGSTRTPFSLVFRSRGALRHASQRIYALHHDTLGLLKIFLVPIGPDEVGMRFEAVFT